jgi:hypothetical protein
VVRHVLQGSVHFMEMRICKLLLALAGACGAGSQTSSTHTTAGSPELRTVDNTGFVDSGGRTRQVSQGVGPSTLGHATAVQPPYREPTETSETENVKPPPVDVATMIDRLGFALCDRASACGKPYESADACMMNERKRVRELVEGRPCGEIPGERVVKCSAAIREASCSASVAIVGIPPACSAETLCPMP